MAIQARDLADSAIDIISTPFEWVFDTVLTEPMAYLAERFFTEAGEKAPTVTIC